MSRLRRLPALVLPWLFVAFFALLIALLLWPRAAEGSAAARVLLVLASIAFVSFAAAALTISRDVLAGRFP